MPVTADMLKALIESELAHVSDERVVRYVRGMLIEPHIVFCDWDYGAPGQQYPCWFVLRDLQSGAEIAYSEYGFGPRCPWGLVGSGEDRRMGMDSGWFTTFLDAFFDSFACVALPIWRVFKVETDGTRMPVTEEGEWDAAWRELDEWRARAPANRYEHGHSINYAA
jgi:hypothetical protein